MAEAVHETRRRIEFLGCPLDPLTMTETVAEVSRQIA